ncbi:MAG: tRNA (adenosine(37)-N6)-threonylcarbamoyltransferase complex ATPase subunit type 1 TsaE [Sedimentisphaerales bacterium]|nr:tRNA (adenosine(37)-N6)-threonylcarbamoyltransferase complex ATPase subunit type 1 TsaE [Sedimentisphaerales bacterium]
MMYQDKTYLEYRSDGVPQTMALGQALGGCLNGNEVIALVGQLGTGKTHLIKGIARALAAEGPGPGGPAGPNPAAAPPADRVTSPTFTLIQEYPGRLPLYHVDAYRLDDARQLEALGFDEFCAAGGVVAVEWADRVWSIVEEYEPLRIELEYGRGESGRLIRLIPTSGHWQKVLGQLEGMDYETHQ